jgi:hypothetical protein
LIPDIGALLTEHTNWIQAASDAEAEERVVYLYKGNKYQLLKDAIRYAEVDQARANPDKVPPSKD